MKSISRVITQAPEINRIQDQVVPAVNLLLSSPFFQPTAKDVTFVAGTPIKVAHGLNKIPSGYIVAGLTAAASIYWSDKDAKVIVLTSSANVTASIIFF